jgi:hypothetical protein
MAKGIVHAGDGSIFLFEYNEGKRLYTLSAVRSSGDRVSIEVVASSANPRLPHHTVVRELVREWGQGDASEPLSFFLDLPITVAKSRWLLLDERQLVDLSTREIKTITLGADGVLKHVGGIGQHVIGIGPDGRTLMWISEKNNRETALVLSDLQNGKSIEQPFSDLARRLPRGVLGPQFDVVDPAWIERHFTIAMSPDRPLVLARRLSGLSSGPPQLVNQIDGFSFACVESGIVPLILAELRDNFAAQVDSAPVVHSDRITFHACNSRSPFASARVSVWSMTIEGEKFELSSSDDGAFSFGVLPPKNQPPTGRGATIMAAVTAQVASKLNEPEWRQHVRSGL